MQFSADCSFHIGAQHLRSGLPCQDHAVCGSADWGTFAIVSDGCSSGGRTDIGSRLMTLGIAQTMRSRPPLSPFEAMEGLGLEVSDLLATSVAAQVNGNGAEGLIRIKGDGVGAFVLADGSLQIFKADWAGNMPWYPAYVLRGREDFIAAHAQHADAFSVEKWVSAPGDSSSLRWDETTSMSAASFPYEDGWEAQVVAPLRAVAVFSDGVCQVDGMSWQRVVLELLAFRSTAGDFVKRRVNRFLRDAEKIGRGPIDDISMACILIDQEPTP
jgi:hypothetical protein